MKKIVFICAAIMGVVIIGIVATSQTTRDNAEVTKQTPEIIKPDITPSEPATPKDRVMKLSVSPEGLYIPSVIKVALGTKIRIEGDPLTLVGGMDKVIIDGYDIRKKISPEDNTIEFIADQTGTFKIYCENGMGNGTLEVT